MGQEVRLIVTIVFVLTATGLHASSIFAQSIGQVKCGNTTLGRWFYDTDTDNCFLVSHNVSSFNDSRNACGSLNAHLATVGYNTFQAVRRSLLISSLGSSSEENRRFWIGLTLTDPSTMTHSWEDKNQANIFRNWAPGEPRSRGVEGCTTMNAPNGTWQDEYCQKSPGYRFVCRRFKEVVVPPAAEKEVPRKVKETWGCPSTCKNCAEFDGFCYYFSAPGDLKTWSEARNACVAIYRSKEVSSLSKSSDLVSIHGDHEQNFLVAHMGEDRATRWIGLHEDVDKSTLYWADTSPVDYRHWQIKEPMPSVRPECIAMYGDAGRAGRWNDIDCNNKFGYICKMAKDASFVKEAPAAGICPPDFQSTNGACFAVFPLPPSKTPESVCQENWNTTLASITNPYENALVFEMYAKLMDYRSYYPERALLGGKLAGKRASWNDGCYVGYSRLYDLYDAAENETSCFAMDYEADWISRSCTSPAEYVVCQKRTSECARPPENDGTCPVEYKEQCGDFCYELFVDTYRARPITRSWTLAAAKNRCQSLNGSLVSIRNRQDYQCVNKLMETSATNIWLGLYRDSFYQRWKWMDPEAQYNFNFANWAENEPSLTGFNGRRENCAEIQKSDGKWNNVQCDTLEEKGFICERKKTPLPTTTSVPITPAPSTRRPAKTTTESKTVVETETVGRLDSDLDAVPPTAASISAGAKAGWAFFGLFIVGTICCVLFVLWRRRRTTFVPRGRGEDSSPFSRLETEADAEHHL